MKTLSFILMLAAVPFTLQAQDAKAGPPVNEFKPTETEKKMGVTSVSTSGKWRMRTGELTKEGAQTFGVPYDRQRFSYATQTAAAGNWTVGIRMVESRAKEKPEAAVYLQGPTPFPPDKTVAGFFADGEKAEYSECRLFSSADGTLDLKRDVHSHYKFGETRVAFDMSGFREVQEIVKSLTALPPPRKPGETKPATKPDPKPQPR